MYVYIRGYNVKCIFYCMFLLKSIISLFWKYFFVYSGFLELDIRVGGEMFVSIYCFLFTMVSLRLEVVFEKNLKYVWGMYRCG